MTQKKGRVLKVSLPPKAIKILDKLVRSGLHGFNLEEAAERIILERLQEMLKK